MFFLRRFKKSQMPVILIFFIFMSFGATPVHAWKLKTHAYIANIVMDDAKDGKVWVPPYGEFEVRPQIVESIKRYPEFFRGGSIGPDGFPDFWTGQAYIHPNTDPWLRLLWNSLPPLNIIDPVTLGTTGKQGFTQADLAKMNAWAFTFGYFSHCAGDMWAHDWVNTYAGKAFPGLAEMKADPTNNIPVAIRHISIETTLDKRVPLDVKTIDVPNDFVANVMVLSRAAQFAGMNPFINYFVNTYFDMLPHKNEVKSPTANDGITVMGVKIPIGSTQTAPIKTYEAFWYEDLERGFNSTDAQNPGWIEANKRALIDVMENDQGMIGALGERLGTWAVTYVLDMDGWPSATRKIGENITWNQAQREQALSAFGLDEATRRNLKDNFVNAMLQLTLGMDKATFDRVWTAEVTSQIFSADKVTEIMAEIGNPPSEATWKNAWNNPSNLSALLNSVNGALYNSVITTKLCMLKPTELERLLGKKLPDPMGQVVIIGAIRGIDFSKQFTTGGSQDGLTANWLGYGLEADSVSPTMGTAVFAKIFKPYRPIDPARQGNWALLDTSHRWGGVYPVGASSQSTVVTKPAHHPTVGDVQPPVLSDITLSQFNSETFEVIFNSNETIQTACLEYKTPSLQSKTTPWVLGQALHGEHGTAYGLSVHEAGMPAGLYKVKIRAKDTSGNETQTEFVDFSLFGTTTDWDFTATPSGSNVILSWNKYPRSAEFQKYVLGKGDQLPPPPSTTVHATSYDADQIRPQQQAALQPIEITNINTASKTVPASRLTGLTLTARSKRGNFLTKPIAPTILTMATATPTPTPAPAASPARNRPGVMATSADASQIRPKPQAKKNLATVKTTPTATPQATMSSQKATPTPKASRSKAVVPKKVPVPKATAKPSHSKSTGSSGLAILQLTVVNEKGGIVPSGFPMMVAMELVANQDLEGPFDVNIKVVGAGISQSFKEGIATIKKGRKSFKWDLLQNPRPGNYTVTVELTNLKIEIKEKAQKSFEVVAP